MTTNYAVVGSIAGAIEACAQYSKKSEKMCGNANSSFEIRFSVPGEDEDLSFPFRDTKKEGFWGGALEIWIVMDR